MRTKAALKNEMIELKKALDTVCQKNDKLTSERLELLNKNKKLCEEKCKLSLENIKLLERMRKISEEARGDKELADALTQEHDANTKFIENLIGTINELNAQVAELNFKLERKGRRFFFKRKA